MKLADLKFWSGGDQIPATPVATEQTSDANERSEAHTGIDSRVGDSQFSYKYLDSDKLSVVFGAIRIRSDTVAQLPLKLYKKTERGHVEATDHPYYSIITRSPSKYMTPYHLWKWVVRQMDTTGNAFVKKLRNGLGEVTELEPLTVQRATITIDSDGNPHYELTRGGETTKYTNQEIIHFKGYSADGIVGLNLVDTFKTLFDNYSILEEAGKQIAKNSVKAPNIIKHPAGLKDEELRKFKDSWAAGYIGNNAGKTGYLPNTFSVEPLPNGLNAADAQYIQTKGFTSQRICSDIYGVPSYMLGLSTAPTFASVEQQFIDFLSFTMNPVLINIEQTINKALFGDGVEYYVKFNTKGLLRSALNDRITSYKFFIENNILTPNQIASIEDVGFEIPADKGGDTYYTSQQLKPVSGSMQ